MGLDCLFHEPLTAPPTFTRWPTPLVTCVIVSYAAARGAGAEKDGRRHDNENNGGHRADACARACSRAIVAAWWPQAPSNEGGMRQRAQRRTASADRLPETVGSCAPVTAEIDTQETRCRTDEQQNSARTLRIAALTPLAAESRCRPSDVRHKSDGVQQLPIALGRQLRGRAIERHHHGRHDVGPEAARPHPHSTPRERRNCRVIGAVVVFVMIHFPHVVWHELADVEPVAGDDVSPAR